LWSGGPEGGEPIGDNARLLPDGATIYVINDATSHPLMAFAATNGPSVYWHNGGLRSAKLGAFTKVRRTITSSRAPGMTGQQLNSGTATQSPVSRLSESECASLPAIAPPPHQHAGLRTLR
jgi:hypothetical protein